MKKKKKMPRGRQGPQHHLQKNKRRFSKKKEKAFKIIAFA